MKTEDFKKACDEIRMTPGQRQKVWRRARLQVQNREPWYGRIRRMLPACSLVMVLAIVMLVMIPPNTWNNRKGAASLMEESVESQEGTAGEGTEGGNEIQNAVAEHDIRPEDYETYLFLGMDAGGHESGRSDAVILVSRNRTTDEVKLVSVPAELDPDCDGDEKATAKNRISIQYLEGGARQVVSQLETCLGISIDGYVSVDWETAAKLVNVLGGVELEVTQEELDSAVIKGYLTEVVMFTGVETNGQFRKAGLQLMDGPKALAWSRVKTVDGQSRESRLLVLCRKLLEAAEEASVRELVSFASVVFQGGVQTSLRWSEVCSLMGKLPAYQIVAETNLAQSRFVAVAGSAEPQSGSFCYVVNDQEGLRDAIQSYLYGAAAEME